MENYKGFYVNDKINDKPKFFEGGAHFKYSDLYKMLKIIYKKREEKNNEKKNKKYFINEKSISNLKNKSRNIQSIFQSFTQRYNQNNKSENGKISFFYNKNINNLTNENIQISFNSKINDNNKPQFHFNSNSSLGKNINCNNNNNESGFYKNYKNINNNTNNNIINVINNLPQINIKNILNQTNNPIQILNIGKNNDVKNRNLNLDILNSNNNINYNFSTLREVNNTFAKKYINPLNKITHFRIISSRNGNNKNISLYNRNKISNNSKSISITKNYLDEINTNYINNNKIMDYNHKNSINEKSKLLMTKKTNNISKKPQSKNIQKETPKK